MLVSLAGWGSAIVSSITIWGFMSGRIVPSYVKIPQQPAKTEERKLAEELAWKEIREIEYRAGL